MTISAALDPHHYMTETGKVMRQHYEHGYADGFDRGAEAVIQQIDGIIQNGMGSEACVQDIVRYIQDFWEGRES